MKVRLKTDHNHIRSANKFNVYGISEILTGDDSVPISNLDVDIKGNWKDMLQAFRDKDIITDNYNIYFGEPQNQEDKKRGYWL